MAFKEELQKLAIQINERKIHITNEEMTKQALILPFIQLLGFDIYNPLEVRPEYIADFGKKKGEKVDYAIFKGVEPIIFIEAKQVGEPLVNHDAQLSRYFNSTKEVSLGVITNGVEYRFFTDLVNTNIMDEEPFLVIDMLNLKESDFENLSKYRKEYFDKNIVIKCAEELVYTSALDESLKELLKNPDDEFIRYLIKDFYSQRITSNVIDKFRPIVKKSISNAVLDIVSKGLYQQNILHISSNIDENINAETDIEINSGNVQEEPKKKSIFTTEDELKAYEYIKDILIKSGKNVESLDYRDTESYFAIYMININRWFIRINLDSVNKNITTRMSLYELSNYYKDFKIIENNRQRDNKTYIYSKIYINSIEDIKKLEEVIISSFDKVFTIE